MPGSFVDSNVLLYLASPLDAKADRAERILIDGGTISVQVLNEFAAVARGKMRLPWQDTRTFLATFCDMFAVEELTVQTHQAGLDLAERYHLSIYDAMIAAAALQAGCDTLLTEDMQHGAVLDGRLRLVDPFG